jgi:hypothetical protein
LPDYIAPISRKLYIFYSEDEGFETSVNFYDIMKKFENKAISVNGGGALKGCEMLIPHYLEHQPTKAAMLSASRSGRNHSYFYLLYSFC